MWAGFCIGEKKKKEEERRRIMAKIIMGIL